MHQSLARHLRIPAMLALIGLASAAIYQAARMRFPLLALYMYKRYNLGDFTHADGRTGLIISLCIVLLFGAYGLGAHLLRDAPSRPLLLLVVLAAPVYFSIILFATQPATSIDLYDYLFRGHMFAHYQANTFVNVPREYQRDPHTSAIDPLFDYVAWRNAVTAYGPLWERMSWLTAHLAGDTPDQSASLLALLMAYKWLDVLGYGLCGAAIWGALGRIAPGQRVLGLYLWFWNPLALWESVAAGHNDAWMMLLIVLAIWLLLPARGPRRSRSVPVGRSISALMVLTFGGLIKYLALFFGPLLLMASLRRLAGWRSQLRLLVIGGLLCCSLLVLMYLPFWVGPETLINIRERRDLYTATWIAAVRPLIAEQTGEDLSKSIASALGLALLVPAMLWASWRSWRAPRQLVSHMQWLLLWFLFVCNPWFQPWYMIWPLALLPLQRRNRKLIWPVIVFCCSSLLSYPAIAFLRPALGWPEPGAAWNGLLSAIIYVPPLLVLGWGTRFDAAAWVRRARRFPRLARRRDALLP